jgi:hypothetical protein
MDQLDVESLRRDYAERSRPVIISGCIDHWPARKLWDLDYFANTHGDKKLRFGLTKKEWVLRDFIEELRRDTRPTPYLNQIKLHEQFPEITRDVGDLKYTRANMLNSPLLPRSMRIPLGIKALFIGGPGAGFGKLHWDYSYLHVYISQVRGAKDFLLYAPEDSQHLYPNPKNPSDSLIRDINDFDPAEYPDVAKATPIRFTVREGETVFVPGGWWHATQMHEISISLAESALDRANWQVRVAFFVDQYRQQNVSPLKVAAMRAYMKGLETVVD